ncbi:hypothetical protein DL96DRAFT_1810576 [Flagelloscypha sp. PMI_526]|nr:hypothetical protein DL96DRAFT_1810576 [Flagelloscypha sp. PMI_526]
MTIKSSWLHVTLLASTLHVLGSALPHNAYPISKRSGVVASHAFVSQPPEPGTWALTNDGGEQGPYWINLGHPNLNMSTIELGPRAVSNYFITYDGSLCEGNKVAQIAPIVENQCYTALYKSVFFSIPTTRSVIRIYRAYECDGTYKSAVLYNFYGCYQDPASESLGSLKTYQGTFPEPS